MPHHTQSPHSPVPDGARPLRRARVVGARDWAVRWMRCVLVGLVWAGFAGSALALDVDAALGELLGQQASVLIETPGQRLSLEEARAAWQRGAFRPGARAALAQGLGSPPLWQRLELDNPGPSLRELHLVAAMTWVDDVEVVLVGPDGTQHRWQAGDEWPGARQAAPGLGLVFPLALQPGRSELWVRAQTPDPMLVPLRLLDEPRLRHLERVQHYGYGLLYGYLLALMAYNAMLFGGLRARSHLYYAAYLLSFIAVNLGYTGHGHVWLWPEAPQVQRYAILSLMVLFGVCGLVFSTRFLDVRQEAPRLWRSLRAIAGGGLLVMTALVSLDWHAAAVWFAFGFLAAVTGVVVGLGVWARHRRQAAAGYFLAAAVCGMGGTLATMLSVWGGLPWNEATFHAIDVGIMVEATLLALALAARLRHQEQAREQAERLARLDPLTGLYNRRAFFELAHDRMEAARRRGSPVCVVMLDVDHFKAINDRFGHDAGDLALAAVGEVLRHLGQADDLVARWGGEEFLMLLPGVSLQAGEHRAEQARQGVMHLQLHHRGAPVAVTASLGVAGGEADASLESLIAAADAALYAAKQAGRNRVARGDVQGLAPTGRVA